jgi:transposase
MTATATGIVAAIGNGAAFNKGREFASWLGLVPKQYSTGGKARLLGISKRGNVYLRKILIHGARAALMRMKRERAPFGAWLDALQTRAPLNVCGYSDSQQVGKDCLGCVVNRQRVSSAPEHD